MTPGPAPTTPPPLPDLTEIRTLPLCRAVTELLRRHVAPGWPWTEIPEGPEPYRAGSLVCVRQRAPGWPSFLLLAPAGGQAPAARMHFLDVLPPGGELTESQAAFGAWCDRERVPHAVVFDIDAAIEILGSWGALAPPLGRERG